jgi:hypothetical protein
MGGAEKADARGGLRTHATLHAMHSMGAIPKALGRTSGQSIPGRVQNQLVPLCSPVRHSAAGFGSGAAKLLGWARLLARTPFPGAPGVPEVPTQPHVAAVALYEDEQEEGVPQGPLAPPQHDHYPAVPGALRPYEVGL